MIQPYSLYTLSTGFRILGTGTNMVSIVIRFGDFGHSSRVPDISNAILCENKILFES